MSKFKPEKHVRFLIFYWGSTFQANFLVECIELYRNSKALI